MICNNNYLADILRVCEIKNLIWVMRFQSPLVYIFYIYQHWTSTTLLRYTVLNIKEAFTVIVGPG